MTIAIIKEAFIVGILVGVVGFSISTILMYMSDRDFSLKKYTFWETLTFMSAFPKSVVLANFLTGFILHLLLEYTMINKYYCLHGLACQTNAL